MLRRLIKKLMIASLVCLLAMSMLLLPISRALASDVNWIEYPTNPVYDPAGRAYYPCVLYDANQFSGHGGSYYYKMWAGGAAGSHFESVTYSNDGINWTAAVEMQGIMTTGYHSKIVYVPGGYGAGPYYYKMWYWNGNMSYSINDLRTADSADGVNWVNDQILTQDATYPIVTGVWPDWNRGSYGPVGALYNPSATNTGSNPFNYTFTLYYDGTTGGVEVIGLGYSADGNHWTRYGNDPVLGLGALGSWDSDYVTNGTVIPAIDGVWRMWYSGSGPSGGGNEGIGYATSSDGINWTKYAGNPIMDKNDGVPWRDVRTYTPSVIYSGSDFDGHGGTTKFKMWYSGRTNTPVENYAIGYAERNNVIPVGPTREYTTITDAINHSFPGDILQVDAGTYNENVMIDKSITIQSVSGAGSTIIDGLDGDPYVVQIRTGGVLFEGFTVTNPEYAGGSDASGIVVTESPIISDVRITANVIHDIGTATRSPVAYGTVGINLGQCQNVEVDNNEIYNIRHGHSGGTWAQGISIWGNDATTLAENINVHDNNIHDISSPNSQDSGIGIQGNVSGITVRDNTIQNSGEYGVDTWDIWGGEYSPTTIEDNDISGASTAGIKMLYPGANVIAGNTVGQCGTGILITATGGTSGLQFNNLDNNTNYGIDNQSGAAIDASWCYWGDSHGPSHDGISYGDAISSNLAYQPYLNVPYSGSSPGSPIQITTASPLVAGVKDMAYSTTLAVGGGMAPYTWFVYAGSPPPGLNLSTNGLLSGVPTAAGAFNFSIEAADGMQAVFKQFSLNIAAPDLKLRLEKTSSPTGSITRGEVLTYTLRLANDNSEAISGSKLTDAIPSFTGYVIHSTSLNGVLIPDIGESTPLVGGLTVNSPGEAPGVVAPGEEAVVTFMVQVGSDLPLGAEVRNVAAAEADGIAPVEASCVNGSSADLPGTWYFAEGSTQAGFDEYILMSNMSDSDMPVMITYMPEGGIAKSSDHMVPAHSRQTVYVNAEMPNQTGVAAVVNGAPGLICERSMYYQHNGIGGGDDVIGANSPSVDLFFAEGFTGTRSSFFEEWILILNPGDDPANFSIDYLFPGGGTEHKEYSVGAHQRLSICVDREIGEGREVSARILSDQALVAERSMYFRYNNRWAGGHTGMAATGVRNDWYLAEGYTGWKNSQFDEWILVANQNDEPTAVTVTYMFPDGTTRDIGYSAAANSRLTISVDADLGEGQMVSAHIHADLPIVVERAMYFNYRNTWAGGHNSLGATAPSSELYFAEGYTGNSGSQFETWLLIQNTSGEEKTARVEYILRSGEIITQDVKVGAHSRTTVSANQVLAQPSLEFSMRVISLDGSASLLAERAMYFNYMGSLGISQGGHDVIGY
ncbi:MAG: hypothetical protein A2Y75_06150 [Candidatus Solincola sediminis]|uniref:Periplasmic copper-binding protein NosD beta helix domain-containing protein n=1 Tax=Candidatus Solincola sediminis TaxID=1797199 RepID=A0A1F2WKH5_9ACTN|nr:MAG: hypothetical protein A2Y75_06150 [Candidatus Solincola sediminis]